MDTDVRLYRGFDERMQDGSANTSVSLSPRSLSRCKTVFNRSQLNIIGGENDGKKLKAHHLQEYLVRAAVPDLEEGDIPAFNSVLPRVFESLLLVGDSENYIAGVGGQDYHNIPQLGLSMAGETDAKAAIRIVYGATEEMPLRGLSYLLPGLIYMDALKKAGVNPPQLQAIFATNISSQLNHRDTKKASYQAGLFASVAKDYVAAFFPKLTDSVVFLKDSPLEKGSVYRNELIRNAAILGETVTDEVDQALALKAISNGSERARIFYAAAHPIFHDMNSDGILTPIKTDQPPAVSPNTIISVGGYQEQDFYKVRNLLKPHLGSTYNTAATIQLFTKHRVPPYNMAQGGDISLQDTIIGSLNGNTIAATAAYDLSFLQHASNMRGNLDEFLRSQRKKII